MPPAALTLLATNEQTRSLLQTCMTEHNYILLLSAAPPSLPAINDITAAELRALLATASDMCPVISAAREAALRVSGAAGPYKLCPCSGVRWHSEAPCVPCGDRNMRLSAFAASA